MVLKCKLQKAVQPTLVKKSEKALVGLFQGLSLFSSSQLFILFSFLGLIGAIIWFTQSNAANDDSDSSSSKEDSSSSSKISKEIYEDEEHINRINAANLSTSASLQQQQQQKLSSSAGINKRFVTTHQIETIYESQQETINVQENNFDLSQSSKVLYQENLVEKKQNKNKHFEEEEIEAEIDVKLIQKASSLSASNILLLSSEENKRASSTQDLVDEVLKGLVTDDKEAYAYSRHENKTASLKQYEDSVATGTLVKDSDSSHNSLLG